jgi:hypothetical protein
VPLATINSGLPLKEKKVMNADTIKSERGLRDMIKRNLQKEFHGNTKPSIDFIHKILEDAYEQGLQYDVTDMQNALIIFANGSTNNAQYCLRRVQDMKFKSANSGESEKLQEAQNVFDAEKTKDTRLVFFDVEVFPNLFICCWKYQGSPTIVRMINPKPHEIESLVSMKLVGFNNRRYDNHILYGAMMGYNNHQLYVLSQKLINGTPGAYFGEAYELSYADIYDFSSKKQSLKKFEIDLGLTHMESNLPWDEPVPEEKWPQVEEYCVNDVVATEATFEDRKGDYIARQILADLSGLSINASTLQHTSKIIFGGDKNPQGKFNYTDLSEMFPGYKYEYGKSWYRDEVPGEGGYVFATPGIYRNVALLDVTSMHPTSIEQLNLFGEYTKNFSDLKSARIAIKRGDYDAAKKMLNGKLERHLTNPDDADALSYALKIVINIVYGVTSASFPNPFKDPRNVDNIVAKRGALFMINLKHEVQERGYTVAHIKTDSIKIPNADQKIIDFVIEYGKKYGYDFEHEATYEKLCLVNEAVYIAKTADGKWTATGAQFAEPYVFKTLFSHEPITFRDMCLAKSVKSKMFLDFTDVETDLPLDNGRLRFVGKIGLFVPVKTGGGMLVRESDDKYYAVSGTKGYRWMEAEVLKAAGREDDIDKDYYKHLVDDALAQIAKYGDTEQFLD